MLWHTNFCRNCYGVLNRTKPFSVELMVNKYDWKTQIEEPYSSVIYVSYFRLLIHLRPLIENQKVTPAYAASSGQEKIKVMQWVIFRTLLDMSSWIVLFKYSFQINFKFKYNLLGQLNMTYGRSSYNFEIQEKTSVTNDSCDDSTVAPLTCCSQSRLYTLQAEMGCDIYWVQSDWACAVYDPGTNLSALTVIFHSSPLLHLTEAHEKGAISLSRSSFCPVSVWWPCIFKTADVGAVTAADLLMGVDERDNTENVLAKWNITVISGQRCLSEA